MHQQWREQHSLQPPSLRRSTPGTTPLENPKIGKVAQNGKFEKNVLSLVGIKLAPVVFDPMLTSYIVNPDNKHGLKDQSERLLNYSMVRITEIIGKGKKQITMDLAPIEAVAPYAGDDARIALALAAHYIPKLDEEQKMIIALMKKVTQNS